MPPDPPLLVDLLALLRHQARPPAGRSPEQVKDDCQKLIGALMRLGMAPRPHEASVVCALCHARPPEVWHHMTYEAPLVVTPACRACHSPHKGPHGYGAHHAS